MKRPTTTARGCEIRVGCPLCDCGDGAGAGPPGQLCPQCGGDLRCGRPAARRRHGTLVCRRHKRLVDRGEGALAALLGVPATAAREKVVQPTGDRRKED